MIHLRRTIHGRRQKTEYGRIEICDLPHCVRDIPFWAPLCPISRAVEEMIDGLGSISRVMHYEATRSSELEIAKFYILLLEGCNISSFVVCNDLLPWNVLTWYASSGSSLLPIENNIFRTFTGSNIVDPQTKTALLVQLLLLCWYVRDLNEITWIGRLRLWRQKTKWDLCRTPLLAESFQSLIFVV